MTNPRRESVTSYWSTSDMNPPISLTLLLTHDLDVRSRGASGRVLLDKLELYCLDLFGEPRPLGFALRIRSEEPRCRQRLEELLEWTAAEPSFQLVALTALAPDLDMVARRLGRGRPSEDTVSEVLAQATQALRWTEEMLEGERRDFVIQHARSGTRGEQRRMARHNVAAVSLLENFDRAGLEPVLDDLPNDLEEAVRRRIITASERHLIESTRARGSTLQAFASAHSENHWALYKRRASAERRLRSYLGVKTST